MIGRLLNLICDRCGAAYYAPDPTAVILSHGCAECKAPAHEIPLHELYKGR